MIPNIYCFEFKLTKLDTYVIGYQGDIYSNTLDTKMAMVFSEPPTLRPDMITTSAVPQAEHHTAVPGELFCFYLDEQASVLNSSICKVKYV